MARRRADDAYPDDKRYNEPFYDTDDPRGLADGRPDDAADPAVVAGGGPDDDDAIGTHVRGELVRSGRVDPREIEVGVAGGVVTLRGRVHNDDERAEAERVALDLDGVREVRNELRVG